MSGDVRAFDLNIEKVLEHWGPPEALRELISNALDESALTHTREPQIFRDSHGWHVRDWGRGLRYEHLTQNENQEKLDHPNEVIGKFGVGLKDALATCDRNAIKITIQSKFGDIETGAARKHGFSDISTLHALIGEPIDPSMVGTDICVSGITDHDVAMAKQFFLKYSNESVLESTKAGQVIQKSANLSGRSKIYVNGLKVAEEPNFLFSYNITSPNKRLLQAMNRERSNVGRTAYADRVKSILLESESKPVMDAITRDMQQINLGRNHEEVNWIDITTHAVRVLNTTEKVLFVTSEQMMGDHSYVNYAQQDGYRPILVNEAVAARIRGQSDIEDQPVRDLGHYLQEWNSSFQYQFVEPSQLTAQEKSIWDLTSRILETAGGASKGNQRDSSFHDYAGRI